eukprot:21010-Heterococcus_DN1.PRE.2
MIKAIKVNKAPPRAVEIQFVNFNLQCGEVHNSVSGDQNGVALAKDSNFRACRAGAASLRPAAVWGALLRERGTASAAGSILLATLGTASRQSAVA